MRPTRARREGTKMADEEPVKTESAEKGALEVALDDMAGANIATSTTTTTDSEGNETTSVTETELPWNEKVKK